MITLNPEGIAKYLGPVVYSRALKYQNDGMVIETWREGDWLCGFVMGSREEPYEASVNLNTGACECECPYEERCKHVGAIMIEEYNFNPPNKDLNPVKPSEEKIKEISLDMSLKSSGYNPIFAAAALQPVKQDQRFSILFMVEQQWFQTGKIPVITAKLRYIKKDGQPGRIEDFKQNKLTEEMTAAESELLEMIMGYYNFGAPLSRVMGFLLANGGPEIWEERDKKVIQIRFVEFSSIEIKFRIDSITTKKVPLFMPIMFFRTDSDGVLVSSIVNAGVSSITGSAPGMVLFNTSNRSMREIMAKIIAYRGRYSTDNIKELSELLQSRPDAAVHLTFPYTKIVAVEGGGRPILDIDRLHNLTTLELLFDYRGREFSFSWSEQVLNLDHLNESDDAFHVAFRDMDHEHGVMRFIINTLEKIAGTNRRENIWIRHPEVFGSLAVNLHPEEFILKFGEELINHGITLRLKTTGQKIARSAGRVAFKVKYGIDWFDVETVYENEDGEITPVKLDTDLLHSRMLKTDRGYVFITWEDIDRIIDVLGQNFRDGTGRIHKNNFAAIEDIKESIIEKDRAAIEKTLVTYEKLKNIKGIGTYTLPEKFAGKLRPYQKQGYNWLSFLREYGINGCLADDMGLGKTVQTLALLQKLKEEDKLSPALLVVPVSTIPNWEQEIRRFTPEISCARHTGQMRQTDISAVTGHDVIITSYHTLRNDINLLSAVDYSMLVLDESQNVKNASSQSFKAVKQIRASQIIALSGTPVENRTGELWALFDILNPGLLGTKESFRRHFANPIEKNSSSDASEKLRRIIFPFILRRKKEMVAPELPPKEEIVLWCEMGEKQKKIYNAFKAECRERVERVLAAKGKDRGAIEIFDALLKLRQIALFPSLVVEGGEKAGSCKFDLFTDMIDEITAEGHKVLVFSQFVKSLKILEEDIILKKLKYAYIDGSTKKRDAEIKNFQEKNDVNVFLLSLKAGGVGINLTAADYVILFDPWWNPAVESQAMDRAHRIGQINKVTVYRLIVKDTVEEKILELQERKKALVNDLITEEASFFKSLSGDDIVNLFG